MEAFGDVEIIIDGRNQRSVTTTTAILETAQWLESLVGVFILLYRAVSVLNGFNFFKMKRVLQNPIAPAYIAVITDLVAMD